MVSWFPGDLKACSDATEAFFSLVHTWMHTEEPCGKQVHKHVARALAGRWKYIIVYK